ncbi:hypothetical protein H3V53_41425, partial [Paraburkholderia bengalensis]
AVESLLHDLRHFERRGHPLFVALRKRAVDHLDASLAARHDAGVGKAVAIGKTVIKAEVQATRAAAHTLVGARRQVIAADQYVRRHPWSSVLVAAGTALAVAAFARRRNDADGAGTPPSADDAR